MLIIAVFGYKIACFAQKWWNIWKYVYVDIASSCNTENQINK
jgi:hypothetical protein